MQIPIYGVGSAYGRKQHVPAERALGCAQLAFSLVGEAAADSFRPRGMSYSTSGFDIV